MQPKLLIWTSMLQVKSTTCGSTYDARLFHHLDWQNQSTPTTAGLGIWSIFHFVLQTAQSWWVLGAFSERLWYFLFPLFWPLHCIKGCGFYSAKTTFALGTLTTFALATLALQNVKGQGWQSWYLVTSILNTVLADSPARVSSKNAKSYSGYRPCNYCKDGNHIYQYDIIILLMCYM